MEGEVVVLKLPFESESARHGGFTEEVRTARDNREAWFGCSSAVVQPWPGSLPFDHPASGQFRNFLSVFY